MLQPTALLEIIFFFWLQRYLEDSSFQGMHVPNSFNTTHKPIRLLIHLTVTNIFIKKPKTYMLKRGQFESTYCIFHIAYCPSKLYIYYMY